MTASGTVVGFLIALEVKENDSSRVVEDESELMGVVTLEPPRGLLQGRSRGRWRFQVVEDRMVDSTTKTCKRMCVVAIRACMGSGNLGHIYANTILTYGKLFLIGGRVIEVVIPLI